MSNHVIHKIQCLNTASSMSEANRFRQEAKKWLNSDFLIILQEAIRDLNLDDDYWIVEKLEFSCPNDPWQLTHEEWKHELKKQLQLHTCNKFESSKMVDLFLQYLSTGFFSNKSIIRTTQEIQSYFTSHTFKLTAEQQSQFFVTLRNKDVHMRFFNSFSENFISDIFKELYKLSVSDCRVLVKWIMRYLDEVPEKIGTLMMLLSYDFFRLKLKEQNLLSESSLNEIITKHSMNTFEVEKKVEHSSDIQKPTFMNEWIHCPNGGLVLILPFVKKLFLNANLMPETNHVPIDEASEFMPFHNQESLSEAIGMLHFLATGQTTFTEEQILLPKIICGRALQEFIPCYHSLKTELIDEAETFLHQLINLWSALKGTSIEGLQTTFLQRESRIKEEDSQYLLQVENLGFDVLLDKLPWGFRMFKADWMSKILITEWH